MKAKNKIYDVTAELEREFGPVGSTSWNEEVDKGWVEYCAEVLLLARKESGMTQAELARNINADKGYVSRVERGKIVPTTATFFRMISAMGMQVSITKAVATI